MLVDDWLINWFEKNIDLTKNEIQKNMKINFIIDQWLDSFQFIKLITEIEDHFKIKFSGDEFHSDEFSTIFGLTQIIKNKI